MQSTCPHKMTLYAFMDGELPLQARVEFDAHMRQCSSCRDELRAMSKVQGALFSRPEIDLGDDDDAQFMDQLMGRMATSAEARRARWSEWAANVAPAAAAAGLLFALALVWTLGADEKTPTVSAGAGLSAKLRAARKLELTRAEADLERTLRRRDRASFESRLEELEERFARLDAPMDVRLERLLGSRNGSASLDLAVIDALGWVGSGSSLMRLDRYARSGAADDACRKATLRAAARIGGDEAVTMIERHARDGKIVSEALAALIATDSPKAPAAAARLARLHADEHLEAICGALAGYESAEVSRSLFETYLSGAQSQVLEDFLARRGDVVRAARRVAFTQRRDTSTRRRAIDLLVKLGDADSTRELLHLVGDRRLGAHAGHALARLGGGDVVLELARRLSLSPDGGRAANALQRAVRGSLTAFGMRGVDPLVRQLESGATAFDANYVLALGYCRSVEAVSLLERLLARDDLKVHVVRALVLIGDGKARTLLERLARDGKGRVGRAARSALQKLGGKSRARRRGWV